MLIHLVQHIFYMDVQPISQPLYILLSAILYQLLISLRSHFYSSVGHSQIRHWNIAYLYVLCFRFDVVSLNFFFTKVVLGARGLIPWFKLRVFARLLDSRVRLYRGQPPRVVGQRVALAWLRVLLFQLLNVGDCILETRLVLLYGFLVPIPDGLAFLRLRLWRQFSYIFNFWGCRLYIFRFNFHAPVAQWFWLQRSQFFFS